MTSKVFYDLNFMKCGVDLLGCRKRDFEDNILQSEVAIPFTKNSGREPSSQRVFMLDLSKIKECQL